MRVLIIENQPERLAWLMSALDAAGCVIAAAFDSARSLGAQIQTLRPDVVAIAQDSPDRDTLEHLCVANQDCLRPIVMFTGDVGIGFWVWDEWNNLNVAHIIIAIFIVGIVGLLLEQGLMLVAKRFSYE